MNKADARLALTLVTTSNSKEAPSSEVYRATHGYFSTKTGAAAHLAVGNSPCHVHWIYFGITDAARGP